MQIIWWARFSDGNQRAQPIVEWSPASSGKCVPGVIAAEGVVGAKGLAAGVCSGGVAGLALPPGAGDGAAGVTAAAGVDGDSLAAGVCDGAVARLALPGAGDGVPGAIAAEGVVGVVDVPVADGRGCPFIPGNGWPR
jgi:hypothetical protein